MGGSIKEYLGVGIYKPPSSQGRVLKLYQSGLIDKFLATTLMTY